MYYVHYDGMDRRLDEWVERNRILERANLSSVPAGLVCLNILIGLKRRRARKLLYFTFSRTSSCTQLIIVKASL